MKLRVSEEVAREVVAQLNVMSTIREFLDLGLEVWAWIEEDVHSDKAVGVSIPTQWQGRKDVTVPAEVASSFVEGIAVQRGLGLLNDAFGQAAPDNDIDVVFGA